MRSAWFGNSKVGRNVGNREPIFFTEMETINTLDGPLTVNGTAFNDQLTVVTTGPDSGRFNLTGGFASISTFGADTPSSIDPFGVPDTATYGQVIAADANHSKLSAFTYEMNRLVR